MSITLNNDQILVKNSAQSARKLTIFVPHASDYLTDTTPHGDGLVAFEVVRRLAERGHVVHVVSPDVHVTGSIPSTLHLYKVKPAGTAFQLRYMLQVRKLFRRLSATEQFDIVHQLNPVFTGISLALAGKHPPVILGGFIADWPIVGRARKPRERLSTALKQGIAAIQQRSASALIVTSPAAIGRIVEKRRSHCKTVVIPHGIDAEKFTPVSSPAGTPPTILFLGGLEHRKGIVTLLDALPLVCNAVANTRLIIAGDGREAAKVAQRVAALPDPSIVEILGRVDREEILGLFARCTVFAMPSLGEPFGMSLLEAMACARPVVVTDAGGPRDIVNEKGGRRVAPGDANALANALIEVLSSPALAQRMGTYNRTVVESTYNWNRVIERLENTYRAIVASGQIR